MQDSLPNLDAAEKKVTSQNGEDGVIEGIFSTIGEESRFYVEFGVGHGRQRNSRQLDDRGWRGLMMDSRRQRNPAIRQESVTAENINGLLEKYGVPHNLDILSIDIDGNDYWVWRAIDQEYRPRLVVIEYNAACGPIDSLTIEYEPSFEWAGTNYFGASLEALNRLAARRGYDLVYCESRGINAFFVRADINPFPRLTTADAWRPPHYGPRQPRSVLRRGRRCRNPRRRDGWPPDARQMLPVE